MASISLSRLLDLAIGWPEVGEVNFNILKKLLHAMLQKLELTDYETDTSDTDREPFIGNKILAIAAESNEPSPYHQLEKKVSWVVNQIEQLNALPSTKQLSDQVQKKADNANSVSNMWQYAQLENRVEMNDDGIQKLFSMLSDLMKQNDTLEVRNASLLGKLDDLDLNNTQLKGQIADLNKSLNILSSRFDKLPSPEDMSNFVTWNNLQDALNKMPQSYPLGNFENICGYFGQLLNRTSKERRDFIDDTIQSDTIHQYLPGIDDNFLKMEPSERYQYIEDSIEKDTLMNLLPQSGSDLLKMNPTERGNFIEDSIKWGTLRVYLPGLEPNFERSSFEERVNTVEDAIKNGNFHKYFPCKFHNVNQMNLVQRKASIVNAIGYGSVESFCPGVKSLTEKMDPDDREQFVEQAAKSGLAETYQDVTGNDPPPLANLKREIDKAIIKECQTLMYENNGANETELAQEPLASLVDVTPARSQSHQNECQRPASRASTPGTIISDASFGGSGLRLDVLERLGSLDDQHNTLVKLVESMNTHIKAREQDLNKLEERIRILEKCVNHSSSIDEETLAHAQNSFGDLQTEIKKLQKTTGDIITENNEKQKQIDNIIQYSEKLYENKADKDYVLGEFHTKADKRQLESKVNYSLFNNTTDEINKTIREVEAKLEGNEGSMNRILQQLSEDVDGKLDKLEMDPLKSWLEGRLRELNKMIAKTQPGWSEDDAAGLRKQLIQRFHCLSCDKTINVMPKQPVSPLPLQMCMPNTRSPRPYTIYELHQIRQRVSKGLVNKNIVNYEHALMERQHARMRKSDLRACRIQADALGIKHDVTQAHNSIQDHADIYAPARHCGGLHTMSSSRRRIIKGSNLNKAVTEEEPKPEESHSHCGVESNVKGVDGVIYKGRFPRLHRPSSIPGFARCGCPTRPSGSPGSNSRPISVRTFTVNVTREEDVATEKE